MSRKEDLEKLILESYHQVIKENDRQIQFATPKGRMQLQRENDEQWSYIGNYLTEYTVLCERLRERALEDIIHIAAHFADLPERLIAAPNQKHRPLPPVINHAPPKRGEESSPFRINYYFVQPFIPMHRDKLAQFVVTFSNRGDVNLSNVDTIAHVCLVLDVSNSMNQPHKYECFLQAIPYILNALSDNDWLSIILFSTRSALVWSRDVASSRGLEQHIIQRIDQSGVKFGRTYLSPGLQIAIDETRRFYQVQPQAVTRLYIFSDGMLHDSQECKSFNTHFKQLGVEINSYGFGQDFDSETLKQIMEGCQGGKLKWVNDPDSLWRSFYHVGQGTRNIIATDAEFELTFSSRVTPGDAFRFDPGTQWFGTITEQDRQFYTSIGGLEKERSYIYAFEARIYPSKKERERIAKVVLRYTFEGQQQSVKQDIWLDRTFERERYKQVDKEIKNVFLMLEELRSDDPEVKLMSLRARLKILRDEDGDPAQIKLVEKAIGTLVKEGTLEGLSTMETRRLRANDNTSARLEGPQRTRKSLSSPEEITDTLKNPLVRRAPYMYEDDPLRQELAQQLDPPRIRRSSRYKNIDEEE